MRQVRNKVLLAAVLLSSAGFASSGVLADDRYETLKAKIDQLEGELAEMKELLTPLQESAPSVERLEDLEASLRENGRSRLPNTLVHLAGYGDAGYTKTYGDNGDERFRVGTFAPIFHFQYRDLVMLEAELEIEVEDDGETSTALEYMTIDVFMNDYAALVAGKFLSPIGQFRQNLHPSWINKMASAPPGFGHDGAAPVSDVGVQVRGGLPPIAGIRTSYAIYASNGPTLNFEDGELEGVDAEGFNEDGDGNAVFGGRISIIPIANLEIGLSRALGEATVNNDDGEPIDISGEGARDYDVYGADFSYQLSSLGISAIGSFDLRGEYVKTKVGATDVGEGASKGADWSTWYTQLSYRFPLSQFESVMRYSDFDSAIDRADQRQWALGINYVFTPNFIGKINYEFNDGVEKNVAADTDRLLFQLAYGF
tara:strand:+ start:59367 stop:60644 length:1278 start_codon:yes stop_codon:yes gene_type:complete